MNLDTMTAKQLREYRDRIDSAIAAKQAKAKVDLVKQMHAMAAEHGFSLSDVLAAKANKYPRQIKAVAKLKDTKTGVVWSGRGRYPKGFDKARSVAT